MIDIVKTERILRWEMKERQEKIMWGHIAYGLGRMLGAKSWIIKR